MCHWHGFAHLIFLQDGHVVPFHLSCILAHWENSDTVEEVPVSASRSSWVKSKLNCSVTILLFISAEDKMQPPHNMNHPNSGTTLDLMDVIFRKASVLTEYTQILL